MLCMEFSRKRNVFPDRGPLCVGVLPLGENRCMADRVGQILGNYQLLRLLGRGAFAEVYLAEHRYLEVPAAIKVLHVRMEPNTQAHFLREARTIAHLQHPHIVRVLDFGFQEQTPYLVMEYTPNGTLRTRHPKGTHLPLEQIVQYVKQVAPALDYAHQQHVIHRDVKPENMLLSATNEVVLSDFGIAVVQQSMDSLSSQSQAGTPVYMAPEQIRGKPCAASDQYAVGVLVYEWLCGEPPFVGSLFEVWSQHLSGSPPSLCARIPSLPPAVEDAVFSALAKEPQARFVSVQDFADVLEAMCEATQPLSVQVPSEHLQPEQLPLPGTLPVPMHAPSPEEQDRFSSATQPLTLASKHPVDTEARVAFQVLPPASQTPVSSGHEGVPVSRTNRQRLLRKVRAFWIAGVLEHSLHGAALLALGLQEQPDAVANPWQLVLQHPAGAPRSLPAGTRITQVYDTVDGELLILGAPGSGKTTLLLELARDLLDRAEREEHHPLPVVFNLSSWAIKQQPLADWLVEELISTYQVPRKLGQAWVDADQILPLLDGLDEVAPKDRSACIESINGYRQEHGLLPLVVCSRSADYLAQTARVRLGSAVAVQPLTRQQVDGYLALAGEPLQALRMALQQDTALRELTSTPLMLSILTLTYHGMPVEDLLQEASLTERQRQIFERYVERMLKRRGAKTHSTSQQTTRWLSWLARQMKQHSQSVFYLEQLQPDWLPGHRMLRVYDLVAIRLPGILMGVLVSLSLSEFIAGGSPSPIFLSSILQSLLLGGFLGGLLSEGSLSQRPIVSGGKARSPLRSRLLRWLLIGALVGLGSGLSYRQIGWFPIALSYSLSLSTGLCSIFLLFLFRKYNAAKARSQVSPSAEGTTWQRLIRKRTVYNGLLVGLLVLLSTALSYGLIRLSPGLSHEPSYGLSDALSYGLSNALSYDGLNAALITGLSAGVLGILLIGNSAVIHPTDLLVWSWRSLGKSLFSKSHASATVRVTVLIGLIVGLSQVLSLLLSIALGFTLSDALSYGLSIALSQALSIGLSIGLSYWLLFGLFQGVSSTTIENQRRLAPNQGIRRSALNGLVLGLISIVIVGPLGWLSFALFNALNSALLVGLGTGLFNALLGGLGTGLSFALSLGLPVGLVVGLSIGLVVGLLKGGLASFRHYVLRFLLWRCRSLPWHYPRFLDYAAEHILLRKVGGGYIFAHRLLLEYFASLDSTPIHDEAGTQKQRVLPVS